MTVTTDDTLATTPRAIRDEMIAFGASRRTASRNGGQSMRCPL